MPNVRRPPFDRDVSKPEHFSPQLRVVPQDLGIPGPLNLTPLQSYSPIGERERQIQMMIDDDDGDLPTQLVETLEQLLNHGRCQAFERLIEQKHANVTG